MAASSSNRQPPSLSPIGVLQVQCLSDSERWFGDSVAYHSLPHHSLALAGEVGEFCNIVKKIDRGSLDIKDAKVRYDLQMEITDVFVYLLNIAGLIGVDLEKSYKHVRALNEERFMAQRAEREAKHG
jgi:NTP pyrophosphatase (non-canonical NTP hydrolase)